MHYGVGHDKGGHSGRYPWGSGENPFGQTHGKKLGIKESNRIYSKYKNKLNDDRGEHDIWEKYVYPMDGKIEKLYDDIQNESGAPKDLYDENGFVSEKYWDPYIDEPIPVNGYTYPGKYAGDYWSDCFNLPENREKLISKIKNDKEMYSDTIKTINNSQQVNLNAINSLIEDLKDYDVKSFRNKKGIGIWSALPEELYRVESRLKDKKNIGKYKFENGKFEIAEPNKAISDEELWDFWYSLCSPHWP